MRCVERPGWGLKGTHHPEAGEWRQILCNLNDCKTSLKIELNFPEER